MESFKMVCWFQIVCRGLIVAAAAAAFTTTIVAFAYDVERGPGARMHGVTAGSDRAILQKTYKRKCTNFKCKQVSEGTQPIFKCPFCGSSTVPVN